MLTAFYHLLYNRNWKIWHLIEIIGIFIFFFSIYCQVSCDIKQIELKDTYIFKNIPFFQFVQCYFSIVWKERRIPNSTLCHSLLFLLCYLFTSIYHNHKSTQKHHTLLKRQKQNSPFFALLTPFNNLHNVFRINYRIDFNLTQALWMFQTRNKTHNTSNQLRYYYANGYNNKKLKI